ncbi:MAG: hypothetical protein IKN73_00270 [Alphaproteobacteria bacterium]|nr:hypothetical protein [Alphaproteobacteria bacterium]
MTRQIQLRRGSAAENDAFTGAVGEITMDTTNNTLRVHDGTTAGGIKLAKQSEIPAPYTMPSNYDFVVESQAPTSANNYTWYRKYKSGWVEQGGIGQSVAQSSYNIIYPIQMRDTNYTLIAFAKSPHETSSSTIHGCHYTGKTSTESTIIAVALDGNWLAAEINWYVCGFCAE